MKVLCTSEVKVMSVLGHYTACSLLISWLTLVTLPCNILSQTPQAGCGNETCQYYCPAGYFQNPNTGLCDACPKGSYQDLTQTITCIPCPAETTTKTEAATSITQCTERPLWKTHAFWLRLALSWTSDLQTNSSTAYALLWSKLVTPVNSSLQTLSSYRGALHLVAFAPGSVLVYMEATFFTTSTTLAELTAVVSSLCNKGTVGPISIDTTAGIDSAYGVALKGNADCTQGQYFSYSTGTCEYCDVTSYQPIGVNDVCFSCPQGYSTGQQGTVGDSSSCLFVCASGWQQVPGLAVCQPCPTGTYKSHTSSLDCTACPTGFTTPFTGSIFPSNCTVPVGSGCSATSCDLGYQCHWDATQAKAVCYCPGTIAGNTCTPNNQTTINTTIVIAAAVASGSALTIVVIVVCAVLCLRRRRKSQLTEDKDNNVQFIRVNGERTHKTPQSVVMTTDRPVMPALLDTVSAQHKAVSVQTSDATNHVTASVQTSLPAAAQPPATFSSTVFSPGALFYDESVGISFDDDSDKPIMTATGGAKSSSQPKVKVKAVAASKTKKAPKTKVKKADNSSKHSPQTPTPIGPADGHVTKNAQSQPVSESFDPPIPQQQQPKQTVITTPTQPKQGVLWAEPTMIDSRPPQHVIDAHNNRVRMTQSLRMYNPQLMIAQPNAMGYPMQQFHNMEFPNGYPLVTDGHMHHIPPMEFPVEFPMDMFPQSRDPGRRRRHHDTAQGRRHHYPSERRAHHRPLAGDGHASKRHRPMKRHTHAPLPESNTYETINPADVTDSHPIGDNFILKSANQPIENQPDIDQSPYESIPADSVI